MRDQQQTTGEGKGGEIVVFIGTQDARCSECGDELSRGSFFRLEEKQVLCLECADLDRLEFLPSGDAALTRRAAKHSPLRAVVVKWSRARKRYERQGILAAAEAIEKAEAECAADAPDRARRRAGAAVRREAEDRQYVAAFADAIRRHFPACPGEDGLRIAAHACQKYSGRVGRSAAAREELDEHAVRLAVVAHIRHVHTNYDRLLSSGLDRREARDLVADRIDEVLRRWSHAG